MTPSRRRCTSKCLVRIERLKALGHELRRPEADTLREGIHELRLSLHGVNYRALYFFSGRRAVLSHGFTKQAATVPAREIDLALTHTARFERDPMTHTYRE